MPRKKRGYKQRINLMRYNLYKQSLLLDVLEAMVDLRYKPSYWNIRKLITRIKRLQKG